MSSAANMSRPTRGTTILTLPPELLSLIISHLYLPTLSSFALSRLHLYRLSLPRLQRHTRLHALAHWDPADRHSPRPRLPYWRTLLLHCLREPETIHYVTALHGPDEQCDRPLPPSKRVIQVVAGCAKTFYKHKEPFFSHERPSSSTPTAGGRNDASDAELVRGAIAASPWITEEDNYSHLFAVSSTYASGYNSQLVPEWKTMDVLGILLPLLYNLEYLELDWGIEMAVYRVREEWISFVQVLERVRQGVEDGGLETPWPKLRELRGNAPLDLFRLLAGVRPRKRVVARQGNGVYECNLDMEEVGGEGR